MSASHRVDGLKSPLWPVHWPGLALGPMLGNEYGRTLLLLYVYSVVKILPVMALSHVIMLCGLM